jgi:hypothetical protein
MSMIFPGMDPYLEKPLIWPGLHASLIVYIRDQLQPQLRPRYVANIEERVFMESRTHDAIPDVAVRRSGQPAFASRGTALADAATPIRIRVPPLQISETYVTILHRPSGHRVVAVIEVLSPTNKYAGPGRDSYLAKQQQVLGSNAHLIEVDLLRYGPHVLSVTEYAARNQGPYDYLVCINRAEGIRENYDLVPWSLRQRLPKIRVPLADNDPDVVLDLQAVLERAYEEGSYAEQLEYDAPCVPALSEEVQQWANECIRQARQPAAEQQPPSA